ncbi:MAG: hypothetical protein ACP5XB_27005 [Isosphaeraceae bacterium]
MRSLNDERPVVVHTTAEADGVWRIDVVGYDAFQFLSTLCALLVVRELSILEGSVFTSRPPETSVPAPRRGSGSKHPHRDAAPTEPGKRPRIVDVFHVRPVHGRNEPDWDEFRAELVELTRLLRDDKFDEVHHRMIPRFVAALGPTQLRFDTLEPIDVTLDAETWSSATEVRIRGRDSFGFLSLTASALALCGIRIVHAEIRTIDERVDDTMWVTDRWGKKIVDEMKLRELRFSLILIEEFSARLPRAVDPEAALVHFSQFATETMARPDWAEEFVAIETPEVLDALVRILGVSRFLWEDYLHAQPENILPMIRDPAQWIRLPGQKELADELTSALSTALSAEKRARAIQRFRDREVFRADMRSILGLSKDLDQFSAELADVAEVLLRAAYELSLQETANRLAWKVPNRPPPSVLCALGKFGGRELGFGSDLEVLVIFDDRAIEAIGHDNQAGTYFDNAVAMLRKVLGSREGHTFDLDFRLRPYGRAGSPATSLSSFLDYYRAGGPAWGYERQALIKLRVIAGDPELGRQVEEHRDRFVYGPEPFDLEGLNKMRRLQVEQLVRSGSTSAKHSPGALVDVEYFVQALQIAHGGREPDLRSPNTLNALEALGAAGHLSPEEVTTLRSSYHYFRMLIDALRVVRDHAQDLTVPSFGTDEFILLSRRMRAQDPQAFHQELERTLRETRELTGKLASFLKSAPDRPAEP